MARLFNTANLLKAQTLQYRIGADTCHHARLYHPYKQPVTMNALAEGSPRHRVRRQGTVGRFGVMMMPCKNPRFVLTQLIEDLSPRFNAVGGIFRKAPFSRTTRRITRKRLDRRNAIGRTDAHRKSRVCGRLNVEANYRPAKKKVIVQNIIARCGFVPDGRMAMDIRK